MLHPHIGNSIACFSLGRRQPVFRAGRAAVILFAAITLLSVSPVFADVVMESGGERFSLDSPGAQPSGAGNGPSTTGTRQKDKPTARQQEESSLPWGMTPEIYVPWQSGGNLRPPYPGGVKPSLPGGAKPSRPEGGRPPYRRSGSEENHNGILPQRVRESKPDMDGYRGSDLWRQKPAPGGKGTVRQQEDTPPGSIPLALLAAGAYAPGGRAPAFGAGAASGPATQPGSFRPPTPTPSTSGVTGSPPGSLPKASPGFSDTAPRGAPERQLYPGMRPPVPGNTPQPVYPGEKTYAPGRK